MPSPEILVYATDYGSNRAGDYLSPLGITVLTRTITAINSDVRNAYVLGFCGAHLPDRGMRSEDGLKWKRAIADERLRVSALRSLITARNTIDEARNTKAELARIGIAPQKIIVYCEWWHSWRVRLVWRREFRGTKVEIVTLPWIKSDDYILNDMRNRLRWATFNLVGFALTLALGNERMRNVRQPARKAR